jgi:broad specificity phosphatase PhoE
MHPPGITRHRRPFFAPVWLSMLAVLVMGGVAVTFYRSATTAVVLLARPVEKEPGTINDPPLSPEGEQRAQQLAQMFGDGSGGGLDAIYVSDDRRARQTAEPLAQRLHRAPVVFSAAEARATASRLLREHAGGTVLVISSGTALAQIVHELSGTDPGPAAQGESDTLYVVSVPSFGRAHVVRLRY